MGLRDLFRRRRKPSETLWLDAKGRRLTVGCLVHVVASPRTRAGYAGKQGVLVEPGPQVQHLNEKRPDTAPHVQIDFGDEEAVGPASFLVRIDPEDNELQDEASWEQIRQVAGWQPEQHPETEGA